MRKKPPGMSRLFADAIKMSVDANRVIALRLATIAKGGARAKRESRLMTQEKLFAAAEASAAVARAVALGAAGDAPHRALDVYSKRVARNLRRLSRG